MSDAKQHLFTEEQLAELVAAVYVHADRPDAADAALARMEEILRLRGIGGERFDELVEFWGDAVRRVERDRFREAGGCFLVYKGGYDEPELVGPFADRDAALEAYRRRLVEAGADVDDDATTESLYLTDDAVAIGRVTADA